MIILQISNQRSYYFIRIDDVRNIGFVWQKLSEKGFYKLHGYFNYSNEILDSINNKDLYFDSLDSFLHRR